MLRSLALAALLALPTMASATTGLEWQWTEGQQRRYVISSQTQVSQSFWIRAQDNLDRRLAEWRINVVTTCTALEPLGKGSWSVSCALDDLAFMVRPTKGDESRVDDILAEYDEKMTGAVVLLKFSPDGRFQTYDLEGVKHNRSNDRTREMQQTMRLLLARAFAGLEVQLPKKGDDKGKSWPVKDPQIMGFPSLKGTTGGLDVNGSVTREQNSKVVIETGGTGTRGPAVYDGRDQLMNLWDMKMFSRATFDTGKGELVKVEMLAEGNVTPSSQLARGGTAPPYIQAINVERVGIDEELAPLPANEVIIVK